MTTIDTAAAGRAIRKPALVLAAVITSFTVAGCETTSNLLATTGVGEPASTTAPIFGQPAAAPAAALAKAASFAIAPVIGAPEPIAGQFKTALASALQAQGVTAATQAGAQAANTLRGYIVSAREPAGTKVSYIWDVTAPDGKRVHRITGEELVTGAAASRDPWQSVSPQLIQTIVGKTATDLTRWLPTQGRAAAAAVASTTAGAAASAARTTTANAARPAAVAPAARNAGTRTTTGSIRGETSGRIAAVPTVTGAPGDGSVSLANAIQKELQRKGVRIARAGGANNYRVEGKVKVGAVSSGQQSIAIDWHVKDPKGATVGTVSQKNQIPAGSLDGAWGPTADAAAAAAAHGIAELLPL